MRFSRVLIMCSSAFQIITAVRISNSVLNSAEIDVVITDHLADRDVLKNRISAVGFFSNVFTMETKSYDWKYWKFSLFGLHSNKEIIQRFPEIENRKYDAFFFANTGSGSVASCMATFLKERDYAHLCMYEDGFASYGPVYKGEFDKVFYGKNLKQKIIYGINKPAIFYVDKYYVSEPEILLDWNYPFEIVEIPVLNSSAIQILNRIYNYEQCVDQYKEKYIFFEESYFADKIEVDDISIVNYIARIVGKENILIKIHPRNAVNRFAKLGYLTNTDTSIPWEVIALNIDIKDKVLITIASGSSITSYFVSGVQARKSILLYDMGLFDKSKLTRTIPVFDKICKGNPYFIYPQSMDELAHVIK